MSSALFVKRKKKEERKNENIICRPSVEVTNCSDLSFEVAEMNVLGLVEYGSDSDQSASETIVARNALIQTSLSASTTLEAKSMEVVETIQCDEVMCVSDSKVDVKNVTDNIDASDVTHSTQENAFKDEDELAFITNLESKYKYLSMLPPLDTSKRPDPETVASVKYYLNAMELHQFDLTENIRRDRDFGNPYILANVVDHFNIDELGSNYPKDMFDPHGYQQSDFQENVLKTSTPAVAQQIPFSVPSGTVQQQQQQQQQQQASAQSAVPANAINIASTILAQLTAQQQLSGHSQHMNRTTSYNQELNQLTAAARQQIAREALGGVGRNSSSGEGLSEGATITSFDGKKRKSKWDSAA